MARESTKKAPKGERPGAATEVPEDRVASKAGAKAPEPRGVTQHQRLQPYTVDVTIVGTEQLLFHRYDVDAVAAQAAAAKGSKEKKTDNIESYLYRSPQGNVGLPGLCFKACLRDAARYFQDPRSPRKSARDLVRAAVRCPGHPEFLEQAPSGEWKTLELWHFIDKRRVVVNQGAVTRHRPALNAGWKLTLQVNVVDPEYVRPDWLNELVVRAGRSIGLCDFRPDFGTFRLEHFEVVEFRD